ncbi:hypothetical protein AMECASPLE_033687 [Ameca splendens]|uniref:Uncharacterized protein n=1 Tax=Ameca splendens TaxID=208324 RepID=A0ABV0XW00_9TELE
MRGLLGYIIMHDPAADVFPFYFYNPPEELLTNPQGFMILKTPWSSEPNSFISHVQIHTFPTLSATPSLDEEEELICLVALENKRRLYIRPLNPIYSFRV